MSGSHVIFAEAKLINDLSIKFMSLDILIFYNYVNNNVYNYLQSIKIFTNELFCY